jgi:pimeloyl-ACP methyl ester carboxylesterase
MINTKLSLFAACLFLTLFSFGQNARQLERTWFSFNQKIDVSNYRGMKFVLEADIKTSLGHDSSGKAQLWARVDTKKGVGFFENMDGMPVISPNWKTYAIEGKIDTNALTLVFGGLVYYNGSFCYDNFKLKVETGSGWKNIEIKNNGFENPHGEEWKTGTGRVAVKVKGYSLNIIKEPVSTNKVLQVLGNGIPIYGIDKSKGKYFSTNGVTLYYETYGSGAPLLLLHGNGQSIEAFNNQIPFFEKKYTLIIPDCRGRGKSTDSNEELTYDIQASDMNNLLDHLKIDSANIIGWSDGGIIALIMAKDYPEKVKRFIASGANVLQDTTAYFPKELQEFNNYLADTSFKGIDRKLINLMVQYPSIPFAGLGKIKCPALIVAGDNDEIRIGHTVKIFEAIPNAQLFIVPKTSHYVLSQNAKVFNDAALKFFQENN